MPYYITGKNAECDGWAVVDGGDGLYGCHTTKASAIKQAVAISLNTDEPFEGERAAIGQLKIGDYVSWNVDDPKVLAQVVEVNGEYAVLRIFELEDNKVYSPEDKLMILNIVKLTRIPRPEMVAYEADTMEEEDPEEPESMMDPNEPTDPEEDLVEDALEDRSVNLTPPAFMRAAARQGLRYYEQGLGGDGLVDATIREARAMAAGNVTADKWVRMGAWIARHTSDLDAPAANPSNDGYPSAGVVAHLLWGSGPSKRSAQRALAYANRVKTKLEEENRAKISVESESMAKVEQRISVSEFEIREDESGMTFEGYAAIFDSPSEPLPFIERIKRGAFNRSLKQARNDIKLLWNHDTSAVLGSTRAGTLRLVEDDRGLKVSATLPNTTSGRDAAVLLKRGDVDSMSFGFSVPAGGDTWNQDGSERTLKSVRLHEVSIVAFPAYTSTAGTTSVRGLAALAERALLDVDELADAMLLLEEGKDLTPEAAELLRTAISELAPKAEQTSEAIAEDNGDLSMLELKKLKLKLMEM
jgi:HK97 family phage prohead protease